MVRIKFRTDNAAFVEGDTFAEIDYVLHDPADYIYNNAATEKIIRDSNGNTIGTYTYTEDES